MQTAGPANLFKLFTETPHPSPDHASVGLDLGFTRAAEKSETTALTLKVCPTTDQTALLVIEMRQLNLQTPFGSCSAFSENFEDQASAIDNLTLQPLFQIALLDRGQRAIDDNQLGIFLQAGRLDPVDLSFPKQRSGADFAYGDDKAFGHHNANGESQIGRFLQPGLGINTVSPPADIRAHDDGTRTACDLAYQIFGRKAQPSESSSESPVKSTWVAG
jgi:hypothetical protein